MKRLAALLLAALFCLVVVGCNKEKKPNPATGTGTGKAAPGTAAKTAPTPKAVEKTTLNDDIPTEQDFEAKAHLEITKKNLKAELKKIEKAVGK